MASKAFNCLINGKVNYWLIELPVINIKVFTKVLYPLKCILEALIILFL